MLYQFGVIDNNKDIKQIYTYADRHLREWFSERPAMLLLFKA